VVHSWWISFRRCSRGGGIANAQMPRQAAVVQQQVADGGADIEANRAEIAELGVDGLQAAFGNENRAAVDIAVQQRFGMGEEAMLQRATASFSWASSRRAATSASSSAG
jgi:hypothetical protein